MNIEEYVYNLGYRVTHNGILINPKGKVITGTLRHKNRKYSTLSFNVKFGEKKKNCCIHRLQAFQKFGNEIYNSHIVVRHIDNNPLNNSYENITIGDYKDNYNDIPEDIRNLHLVNMRNKKSIKYNAELTKNIFEDFEKGSNRTQISQKYNVPITAVYYIKNKYKHD